MSNTNTDSAASEPVQELPAGFVPGEHDVVIGKGKILDCVGMDYGS